MKGSLLTAEFENVVALADSGLALLVQFEDREDPVWIPQGQIHEDSEVYRRGHVGRLVISQWIAEQKGLV